MGIAPPSVRALPAATDYLCEACLGVKSNLSTAAEQLSKLGSYDTELDCGVDPLGIY